MINVTSFIFTSSNDIKLISMIFFAAVEILNSTYVWLSIWVFILFTFIWTSSTCYSNFMDKFHGINLLNFPSWKATMECY